MIRVDRKPLSVNDAYLGKKRPTNAFNVYRINLGEELPDLLEIPKGQIFLYCRWGFSTRSCDVDNPAKPFIDNLSLKYGFNDNKIYRLVQDKVIVPKGEEFIEFGLWPMEDIRVEIVNLATDEVIL